MTRLKVTCFNVFKHNHILIQIFLIQDHFNLHLWSCIKNLGRTKNFYFTIDISPDLKTYFRSQKDILCFDWQSHKIKDIFSIHISNNCYLLAIQNLNVILVSQPIRVSLKLVILRFNAISLKRTEKIKYNNSCRRTINKVKPIILLGRCPMYQHYIRIEQSRTK